MSEMFEITEKERVLVESLSNAQKEFERIMTVYRGGNLIVYGMILDECNEEFNLLKDFLKNVEDLYYSIDLISLKIESYENKERLVLDCDNSLSDSDRNSNILTVKKLVRYLTLYEQNLITQGNKIWKNNDITCYEIISELKKISSVISTYIED